MVIIELVDTIGIEPPCLLITLGPFYKSSGDKLIVNTVHTGVVIKVVFGNFTSIVIEQISIVRGGRAQLRYSSCTAYSGARKIGGDDGYPSGRWLSSLLVLYNNLMQKLNNIACITFGAIKIGGDDGYPISSGE